MTIVDKLRKLITTKGGDPTGVMTIAEGVDRLEKTEEGGGGGNSGVLKVALNRSVDTESGDYQYSSDIEPAEVVRALEAGKLVFVEFADESDPKPFNKAIGQYRCRLESQGRQEYRWYINEYTTMAGHPSGVFSGDIVLVIESFGDIAWETDLQLQEPEGS